MQKSKAKGDAVFGGGILELQFTVTLVGQVNIGGTKSATIIACVQVDVFPQASVVLNVLKTLKRLTQV